MRYFFVFENQMQREARLFFSAGLLSFALAGVLSLFDAAISNFSVLLDLLGCVLFFSASFLWGSNRFKVPSAFFLAAFVFRLLLLSFSPKGLFGFLLQVPFSVCVLIGVLWCMDSYGSFLRLRAKEEAVEQLSKASKALIRAEVSFWIGTLLAYISDLLALPALVMLLWSLAVRVWAAWLFLRSPKPLSFSELCKRIRPLSH